MAPRRIVRVLARMNVGGPARQVIELARGLERFGYETVVATGAAEPWEGDLAARAAERGVRVVAIPGLAAPVRPASDARALAALVGLLRSERPAIVHTHTAKAGALGRVAAKLAGARVRVHTFHGTVFDQYFSPGVSRWVVRAERGLARLASRLVAVSHAVADELESAGIPKEKVRVIEPVVDLAPFFAVEEKRGNLRSELGIAPEEILVGWVGRHVPVKDPESFLDAASIVGIERPRVRFVMVGAGPLEGSLRAKAERLGLAGRLAFSGFREDMPGVLADLDLLASTSRKEGMPVAILEAMAAGVPVVATAVGGTPELVAEERSGFLVPPGEPRALARAIARALDLPREDFRTMRGVARVRARERFGLERGLARHAQLYAELLEGN